MEVLHASADARLMNKLFDMRKLTVHTFKPVHKAREIPSFIYATV